MKLNEILNGVEKKLYLRAGDYNRQLALTEFIKVLEKQDKDFKIGSYNAKILQCRDLPKGEWFNREEETEKLSLYNYVGFEFKGVKYYLQINDNPYFESYICVWNKDKNSKNYQTRKHNKRIWAFEELRDGANTLGTMFTYNGKENIIKLKNELMEDFKELVKEVKQC